jgi:acylphosphatase
MQRRIHAFVSGRVQGVNYRFFTQKVANMLGIKGWVRNLPDGRVEVVAEGEEDAIKKFIDFLHEGPIAARVDNVDVNEEKFRDEFENFEIRFL